MKTKTTLQEKESYIFGSLYRLSEDEWKKLQVFVAEYDYSEHKHRGQTNLKVMKEQNAVGKIAEFVTYHKLKPFMKHMPEPDLQIYDAKHKSFDPDLPYITRHGRELKISVKGQATYMHMRYGYPISWLFNKGNIDKGGGRDQVLHSNHQGLVVFVLVDYEDRSGRISAIVPVRLLHELDLWRPPDKEKLRKSKQTIHLSDLREHGLAGRLHVRQEQLVK